MKSFGPEIKLIIPWDVQHEVIAMGADSLSSDGETQAVSIHIWEVGEDDKPLTLTGKGFWRTMAIVRKAIRMAQKRGFREFAIEGICDKRTRVFAKFATRAGAKPSTVTDFFGDDVTVFTFPKI